MKTDLSFTQRAYLANLARARSMTLQTLAGATIADKQKVEFAEEARFAEGLAQTLDAGEEIVLERKEPIVANPRIDIDHIDDPKTLKGGGA